jgi:hypothetical protein
MTNMSTHNNNHHANPALDPLGGFFGSFVRQLGSMISGR